VRNVLLTRYFFCGGELVQVVLAYAERGGGFCGCQHGGSNLYSHSNAMIEGGCIRRTRSGSAGGDVRRRQSSQPSRHPSA
jgi:hypothetical protein